MRRIISEEERAAREKRRIRILSMLLLIIMVGSTAGYAFIFYTGDANQNNEPTGQNSEPASQNTDKRELFLTYPAEDVKSIPVSIEKTSLDYSGQPFYVAGADEDAIKEISRVFATKVSRIQQVCYGKCESDLPEMNCSEQLIVLIPGDAQKVYQNEQCVFIEGDLKALDAFLYYLFK